MPLPFACAYCAGKESRLKGFEFPKALHLDPAPFSIEADLITPKMSLKRPQLLKHYKTQVGSLTDKLLAGIGAEGSMQCMVVAANVHMQHECASHVMILAVWPARQTDYDLIRSQKQFVSVLLQHCTGLRYLVV